MKSFHLTYCVIWDQRQARSLGFIYGPYLGGDSIDYKKGKGLLIGSYAKEKNLQLFDLGKRQLIRTIPLKKQNTTDDYFVYVAKFAPSEDETIVVGTAGVNEI